MGEATNAPSVREVAAAVAAWRNSRAGAIGVKMRAALVAAREAEQATDDADDVKVNDYCDHDGAKCHHNCHPGRCFRAERGFGELSGIAEPLPWSEWCTNPGCENEVMSLGLCVDCFPRDRVFAIDQDSDDA